MLSELGVRMVRGSLHRLVRPLNEPPHEHRSTDDADQIRHRLTEDDEVVGNCIAGSAEEPNPNIRVEIHRNGEH